MGHYQKALELDPNFVVAHMYLGQALEQKGRHLEALNSFDTAIRLSGGSSQLTAMKAHACALAGDAKSARELLGQLQRAPFGKCLPSYDIAATHCRAWRFNPGRPMAETRPQRAQYEAVPGVAGSAL
jgi:tetratricopeptide (TPR) repeat protein